MFRKSYKELTKSEKKDVHEHIRKEWLEDAKQEAKQYPNCEGLQEIIEHLEANDEACQEMIGQEIDEESEMFINAMKDLTVTL